MSIQRRLTEQMTHAQALKLRSLSQEAYQPKLYEKNLTLTEAACAAASIKVLTRSSSGI